jgi:hypothetical protein
MRPGVWYKGIRMVLGPPVSYGSKMNTFLAIITVLSVAHGKRVVIPPVGAIGPVNKTPTSYSIAFTQLTFLMMCHDQIDFNNTP